MSKLCVVIIEDVIIKLKQPMYINKFFYNITQSPYIQSHLIDMNDFEKNVEKYEDTSVDYFSKFNWKILKNNQRLDKLRFYAIILGNLDFIKYTSQTSHRRNPEYYYKSQMWTILTATYKQNIYNCLCNFDF